MKIEEYGILSNGAAPAAKKTISVRLSYQMLAHLELLCIQHDVSKNLLIRQAIFQFLKEQGIEDPHQF